MIKKIIAAVFVLSCSVGAVEAQTCPSYPNTLTNGQPADASQVMANFSYILNCLNNTAGREVLTANRTYYVRSDGNDSNNCLSNTSGGACLTIQRAVNLAYAIDGRTFNVTIQVNCGSPPCTFTGATVFNGPFLTSGTVSLVGDTTTPSNVTLSVTGAHAIFVTNGAKVQIAGFKITTTGTGHGLNMTNGAVATVNGKMEWGAINQAGYAHMNVNTGAALLYSNQSYTISGNFSYHLIIQTGGAATYALNTVTITNSPTYTVFCEIDYVGVVSTTQNTYSGAVTSGQRYLAQGNGVINTFGAGAQYFPGTVAGSVNTGGQYI